MAATAPETEQRERGPYAAFDFDAFSDLLHELFPLGLTDDAPIRRELGVALEAKAAS
jgi:hypothetical protein